MLPLVEDFYSLQGEGANAGRAAWFVRLAGCDVGCVWCDSMGAWNEKECSMVPVDEIVERATKKNPSKNVVVTGGEPLMHDLGGLAEKLHKKGATLWLETSGTHPFSGWWDWVCLSPKSHRPPLDEAWERADELKVVVASPDDFVWAEQCAAKTKTTAKFLQPEWGRAQEILPHIVEYIKQNPRWRLSLQAHKYIGIA